MKKIIVSVGAILMLTACGSVQGPQRPALPDPDGAWYVTAHVQSCYEATGSNVIAVSNGSFNRSKIFTYTHHDPRYSQTETVTITGTITKGPISYFVEGNMFLTGNACNGGNGFNGYIENKGGVWTGGAASAWGTLQFTKQ